MYILNFFKWVHKLNKLGFKVYKLDSFVKHIKVYAYFLLKKNDKSDKSLMTFIIFLVKSKIIKRKKKSYNNDKCHCTIKTSNIFKILFIK